MNRWKKGLRLLAPELGSGAIWAIAMAFGNVGLALGIGMGGLGLALPLGLGFWLGKRTASALDSQALSIPGGNSLWESRLKRASQVYEASQGKERKALAVLGLGLATLGLILGFAFRFSPAAKLAVRGDASLPVLFALVGGMGQASMVCLSAKAIKRQTEGMGQ